MWKTIVKWFVLKAWPVILEFIKKYEREIMEIVFKWVDSMFKKRNKITEDEFRSKAEQAEKKANETEDIEKRREYAAQADAFRQALNILERQNQELKEELEKVKRQVQVDISRNTASLNAEDVFSSNRSGELKIYEKPQYISIEGPKE